MKQPYNTTVYNTALYLRLSRDDELQGESGSIQTQRMMLRQYAAEHGLTVVDEYIDCLLYTSPSPRDRQKSRMPSSA